MKDEAGNDIPRYIDGDDHHEEEQFKALERKQMHQTAIVLSIFHTAAEIICKSINEGKIPENWDGFELRQYCADYINEHYVMKMDRVRLKEYKDTVIINNL